MKRRLLALALALCMALSLVPAAAAADANTNTLYYKTIWSSEETFHDPLVLEPNTSDFLRFFTDEACTHEVTENLIFTADEGSPADAIIPTRDTDWDGNGNEVEVWRIYARSFGTGTLTYTDGGTTYTLAVSCVLPEQGFSSTPELTKETYLISGQASFVVGEPFYYVFPEGTQIQSVKVDQCIIDGDELSVEVLTGKPNVCKLTVTAAAVTPRAHSFRVAFTLVRENSPTGTKVDMERISLRDATPRFGFRDARWINGELNGYRDSFRTSFDLEIGGTTLVGFFYGNEQANEPLHITSAVFYTNDGKPGSTVTAEKWDGGYWKLTANALGEGVLVCTAADGAIYTMPVRVALPYLGFYTSQTRSADACIADFFYYNAKTGTDTFWLIREDGFTAAEADAASLTCEYNVNTNWYTPAASDYFTWQKVVRADAPDRYDLKFTVRSGVTIPQTNLNLRVELPNGSTYLRIKDELTMEISKPAPSALTVTIDGKDYVVGFGTVNDGILTVNLDGNWSQTHPLPQDDGTGAAYRRVFGGDSWQIYAATVETRQIEDGTEIVCTPAPAIRRLVRVNRVWLERRSGSGNNVDGTDSFSLADTRLLERTNGLDVYGFPLYVADKIGEAYLCAKISVGDQTGTIYYGLKYVRSTVQTVRLDSVEAINQWLIDNAEAIRDAAWNDSVEPVWNLELTGKSYKGTVTMPEILRNVGYGRGLGLRFLGQNQTFTGSIDLGGTAIAQIGNLNFVAPETGSGTAISQGSATVYNCTFTGYETALGSGNTLMAHDCRFIQNDTAIVLDIPNPALGCTLSDFSRNYFEKNGTALRIVSTNSFVSPYYIRPHDSVFLGNTVDFDVRTAGTFYFLCNFFAHHDSILPSIRPVVNVSNGATVYVNPIWKYRDADTGALRELTLVEGVSTRLPVNEDWSNTSIAADSLTSETQIALADENDKTVATWSDFREQAPAQQSRFALYSADETGTDTTPDGFRPGVSIDTQPTGEQTVTVADSAALAVKTPLLTIPCTLESAVVRLNGKPVASTLELEGGKLSFRVTTGGTYTVRPGTSEKYEGDTITIENAPEDARTAIAALYDANHRFLTAATAQITNGAATILLKKPDPATCRIYYLTAKNTPAN
ncbi:MAG: hypothetical protein MSC56_03885 [Clostridiales bacterium]|nr:hypothetical protein [Clostridiales bacterium]